jgi:DNA-binding Lrp family transcriptional regulator
MTFMGVLEKLADDRSIAILKVFAKKPEAELSMTEIQKKAKLPVATTFRQLKHLVERGFLSQKKLKHLTIYALAQNDLAQTVISLLYEHPEPLRLFLEKVEQIPTVTEILMNGKTENSANIIIIGDDVPKAELNTDVALVLDRYSYKINHIVLEPEAYQQMVAMNLYPTKPQILYRKLT